MAADGAAAAIVGAIAGQRPGRDLVRFSQVQVDAAGLGLTGKADVSSLVDPRTRQTAHAANVTVRDRARAAAAIDRRARAVTDALPAAIAGLADRVTRLFAADPVWRANPDTAIAADVAVAARLAQGVQTRALRGALLPRQAAGTAATAAIAGGHAGIRRALAGDRARVTRRAQRIARAENCVAAVAALGRALALHTALARAAAGEAVAAVLAAADAGAAADRRFAGARYAIGAVGAGAGLPRSSGAAPRVPVHSKPLLQLLPDAASSSC